MFIAILGVLTALALPSFSYRDSCQNAVNLRNAKEIANIATAASLAGVDLVVAGDLQATITNLVNGVSPANGPFRGRVFRITGMSEETLAGAMQYLRVLGSELICSDGPTSRGFGSTPG